MGIDPGLATTGYGIIQERATGYHIISAGTVTTPAQMAFGKRLHTIYDDLTGLMQRYRPDVVAIEQLFFARNVTTALTVGQARGVAYLAAIQMGCRICEFTPLQVKQAVTGYGQADKSQMQKMVKQILKLRSLPRPDDMADALAIALCGAHTHLPT